MYARISKYTLDVHQNGMIYTISPIGILSNGSHTVFIRSEIAMLDPADD
ncbi:MAG: hypothetical protein V4857_08070 [Pseudomonadota bacterium]